MATVVMTSRFTTVVQGSFYFCTSCAVCKTVPKNLRGRNKSSQDWLTRQLNDPYVKLAKQHQYRARSAFKLIEIDKQCHLLQPGQVVVECGAAPGAWTQVAVMGVNSLPHARNKSQGMVIGIDLQSIHPLAGATLLGGRDFTSPQTQQQVLELISNRKIDVVLSDMAPKASGIKDLDHENIISLAYAALGFAVQNTAGGGSFLCKVWEGFLTQQLINDMKKSYRTVKVVKPPASRGDSSEKFLVGKELFHEPYNTECDTA
ncbi:rRNA methyltransferase 2, mitochondrial-like isoform X2 [Portunus trituberculatus]|uniref:rRNA methyltransferase 2, mitochondrial-like isoform X2 n=1 Tax=Portunus trituberculatus TaxID=210409 RepID=UPI001E1D0A82|nr:rRNA methyltransferase 2, mitochondrial-like isoform X2 [Portunus trituberculatus]